MVSRKINPLFRKRCPRACETCKRRKQGCDGSKPCKRCSERGVGDSCFFEVDAQPPTSRVRAKKARTEALPLLPEDAQFDRESPSALPTLFTEQGLIDLSPDSPAVPPAQAPSPSSIGADLSRFIQDKKGRLIFIGDSANLSFLHTVRGVVRDALGPCPFVDDPLRSSMVEVSPDASLDRLEIPDAGSLPHLSEEEAKTLVRQFFIVANGIVDIFEEVEVMAAVSSFLRQSEPAASPHRAIICIILAIGAQSEADPRRLAKAFFNYSRFSAGCYLTEDVSIQSTQLYLLLTLYLLGASRRNVAFVCLGHAIRSAYTLGIHQQTSARLFSDTENRDRVRLWTSIRVMDLFTSASLGRPPATVSIQLGDSSPASLTDELYGILETILTDVYGQHKITRNILARTGSRQRKWAARFACHSSNLTSAGDDKSTDLGGLIMTANLKQAYYWTIMLLTRPFLVDRINAWARQIATSPRQPLESCVSKNPSKTLIYACVDSAVKTISLMEPFFTATAVPYHLPMLINAAFHAALIAGFAYFGDLYVVFPLERTLKKAITFLQLFPHDSIAIRYLNITHFLSNACSTYYEHRHAADRYSENEAISLLFGQIHEPEIGRFNSEAKSPVPSDLFVGQQSSIGQSDNRAPPADAMALSQGNMLGSPYMPFENEMVMMLSQSCDIDLEFPTTAQHVWVDSGSDLPSIFVGNDSSMAFLA